MTDPIKSISTHIISIPRDTPYLGPLAADEAINSKGYVVRQGNRSIYPTSDMSILVRCETVNGAIGWGECYGICAPEAVCAIINDLLAPCIIGRDPFDVQIIHDDLYDLMRVRGFGSGYYVDALAGIDIGLWDLCGLLADLPVSKLLGGQRRSSIPAYVSGLPKATLDERIDLAMEFQEAGYCGFKFAAAVSRDRIIEEASALRHSLGNDVDLMVDMHWKYTADEAVSIISRLTPQNLYFAEAPCKPEDLQGLTSVAQRVTTPIAAGEEWHTVYEARPRLEARACSILQPEMAHTGITQFMRIATIAQAFHCKLIPHASIGIGIFQAASLQASAAILELPYHEYQHSVFDRNLRYLDGTMTCKSGRFQIPDGAGLGVSPREDVFQFEKRIN